jgi:hypothetical protein
VHERVYSISLAIMTKVLGKLTEEMRKDIKDSSIHSCWPV